MLAPDLVARLAAELHDAKKRRVQVRHFSMHHPGMTIADGYAIQRAWVALKPAGGRTIKGRKIGLTSRAMQLSSQITEPDFAPLLDDMFFEAGGDIPVDRFIAPRVEVEPAFIVGKPLKGPGVTLAGALAAIELVTPAVEIIDARIEQFDRAPRHRARSSTPSPISPPTPASSSVAGRCGRTTPTCAGPAPCSTRTASSKRRAWPRRCSTIRPTASPGSPTKIAVYDEQLDAGVVVLAGSFTLPTTAARGNTFHVDCGRLGAIAFRFA